MLRLALVGCGEHSRSSHAAPLARYAAQRPGHIELTAACDLNQDRAEEYCRTFGFARAYSDLGNMLDQEQLDGCVTVMPMDLIVPTAIRLMKLGLPCVIEKPLGTSLSEAELLLRSARETQTPHMVSVNRRFMPYLNRARSWANSIGTPQYVRATQVRDARAEDDFIWATAIHALDAVRYIAGEVTEFNVEVQTSDRLSAKWFVITLGFENGTNARVEVLPTAGMVEESYELFGEGYRARVTAGSGPQRSLECWRSGKLDIDDRASESEPEDLRNGSYQEVEEFVGALRNSRRPQPEVADIFPSARICFTIADLISRNN